MYYLYSEDLMSGTGLNILREISNLDIVALLHCCIIGGKGFRVMTAATFQ